MNFYAEKPKSKTKWCFLITSSIGETRAKMEQIRLTGLKCLHGEAIPYNRGLRLKRLNSPWHEGSKDNIS